MIAREKHSKFRIGLIVSLVLFAPLAISIPYLEYQARSLSRSSAVRAANVILEQAESILDQVELNIRNHGPVGGAPCAEWVKAFRIMPYVRSAFVMKGDGGYCSSVSDSLDPSMIDFLRESIVSDDGFTLDPGGPFSPGKLAIRFQKVTNEGWALTVFIETQYFKDLMYAPAWDEVDHIDLRLNNISLRSGVMRLDKGELDSRCTATSRRYPLSVDAYPAKNLILDKRRELILKWFPWLLTLGSVLSYLVHRDMRRRTSITSELALALENNEFFVVYQPVVNAVTGQCTGAEALLRWNHPLQGLISPDVFIPQAESCGKIVDLTHRLLRCVKEDLENASLPKGFHLALNIAVEHFGSQELFDHLSQLPVSLNNPDLIIVAEITERQLASNDEDTRAAIQELRKAGVQIAIDDFGTGHSSLAHLQKFELDYLKIDKFFVSTVGHISVNTPVLDAIIELGKRLELKLVAEGVEDEAQADFMRHRGVDYLQGFRYARPMPWENFERWLKSRLYS
ncbi:EAL domain-containing protein [Pseudomonas soli]|uniref:EAL domain-containing protein n=1 Tax=Pseudomonas soli TaxID=1306993 RepID=UPI00299E8DDB|nr:EAL domain-containing protein [Pseudomonas soli]MDW9402158.1 EAL domain-containing protein [Pseudomonas soli]